MLISPTLLDPETGVMLHPWAYLVGTCLQCTYILPDTTYVTWLCVPLVRLTPILDISVISILSCFRFIDTSWLTFLFGPPFTQSHFSFSSPASLPILARVSHICSYYQDLFCSLLNTLLSISQPMLGLLTHHLGLLWLDLPVTQSFMYSIYSVCTRPESLQTWFSCNPRTINHLFELHSSALSKSSFYKLIFTLKIKS